MIQYSYTFDPETRTLTPSGDPVNVKNDTNVVQIVFTMPASYEGLALSSYVWRVFYKIAMNTKLDEVRFHQFTDQTTEGENLVLTWTVTNSVTEFAGHLGFALSGTLTDTGGNVTNRINSIPAYERIEPTIGGGSYTEDDAEIEGIKDFLVGIQEAAEAAQAAAETAAAEAEASAARAEQIADELEPYKSLAIVESASGDPATFTDGSNGVPMKSVSVDIDPVQDLHGYEYPWVGGAGKNLLPFPYFDASKTQNGITFTAQDDGSVIINGTATGTTIFLLANASSLTLPSGNYVFSVQGLSFTGSTNTVKFDIVGYATTNGGASGAPFESNGTALGNIRIVIYSGVTLNNERIYPMIRSASIADTTYEPYSNICPISGWDEVKVTRTGKNLFAEPIVGSYINDDGTISTLGNSNWRSDVIRLDGQQTSITGTIYERGTYTGSVNVIFFDENMAMLKKEVFFQSVGQITTFPSHKTITIPSTARYMYFRGYMAGGATSIKTEKLQAEFGTASTDYAPYASDTYPISLTSAGTVYGGTLDATTGELVVDRKMVDLGSLTYTYVSTSPRNDFMATLSDAIVPVTGGDTNAICSCFGRGTFLRQTNGQFVVSDSNIASSSRVLNIRDTRYTDATSFKTAVTGQTLVYTLATPQSYTLTPTQITSLLGTNHVCADCGEVAVEYVADTKIYIDKIVASL